MNAFTIRLYKAIRVKPLHTDRVKQLHTDREMHFDYSGVYPFFQLSMLVIVLFASTTVRLVGVALCTVPLAVSVSLIPTMVLEFSSSKGVMGKTSILVRTTLNSPINVRK